MHIFITGITGIKVTVKVRQDKINFISKSPSYPILSHFNRNKLNKGYRMRIYIHA